MPELNKANRMVCDVDIRILATMMPFLDFKTANTTTVGLTGETVYAKAKGTNRIGFPDPIEGSMSIEAQVYPFKLFSMFSDGTIENSAVYADSQVVKSTNDGEITLNLAEGKGTIQAGQVFVFPEESYGDESKLIKNATFTSTDKKVAASEIKAGTSYKVGYLVSRDTGVRRISFNNRKTPRDYYITMKTVDKNELGQFSPFIITAYKAVIKRNFELSFSSEGDPATVTLDFDLMEDKDGNVLDMIEDSGDTVAELS